MNFTIDVIGVGAENALLPSGAAALARARRVAGSARLLASTALPEGVERIVLDGRLTERLAALPEEDLAVLASGDPLYYGVGGTLKRIMPAETQWRFHPAPTAFQELFARLGQDWSRARLFSLHGGRPLPFRAILRSPVAAIYGDAARPAPVIAAALVTAYPAAAGRRAAIGCDLGLPEERVWMGTLGELMRESAAARSLSVLALLPDPVPVTDVPDLPLGLPDEHYQHYRNMITHPEVRAVVLAKLRLPSEGVLWDLGAGSGSVGLEAAGLCPGLQVWAVEKDAGRLAQLRANLDREGLANVTVKEGIAGGLPENLPRPCRIFIGGGGRELLERGFAALAPGGRLVMTAVTVETVSLLGAFRPENRRELLSLNLARAEALGTGSCWKAENPIVIAVFEKCGECE